MAAIQEDGIPSALGRSVNIAIPAILVLVGYGLTLSLRDIPEQATVDKLRADLTYTEGRRVDPAQIEVLEQRQAEVQKHRAASGEEFQVVKKEAERLATMSQESSLSSIGLLTRLTSILERNGLVTAVEGGYEKGDRPKLFGFVDDGIRALQTSLTSVAPKPAQTGPMVPEFFPPGTNLSEMMARRGAQNAALPKLALHEIEVWGSYRNLVGALSDIALHCDDSVVVGVDFQRYHNSVGTTGLRIKLLMNFQSGSSAKRIDLPTEAQSGGMLAGQSTTSSP